MINNEECPQCNANSAGHYVLGCLCTVTPFFCDACVEFVLKNYSCPTCSAILPERIKCNMGTDDYIDILKNVKGTDQ